MCVSVCLCVYSCECVWSGIILSFVGGWGMGFQVSQADPRVQISLCSTHKVIAESFPLGRRERCVMDFSTECNKEAYRNKRPYASDCRSRLDPYPSWAAQDRKWTQTYLHKLGLCFGRHCHQPSCPSSSLPLSPSSVALDQHSLFSLVTIASLPVWRDGQRNVKHTQLSNLTLECSL